MLAGLFGFVTEAQALDPGLVEALERVNGQCPEEYPEVVTPLPEDREFAEMETVDLMQMLGNWNPALRSSASGELGRRGDGVVSELREATRAPQGAVRAGAAKALAAILKAKLDGWQEVHPDIKDAAEAQAKIRAEHSGITGDFIRLTKDPVLAVRVAAMSGMSRMAPQTPEAVRAVLTLCGDEDDYLAQDAMIALDKVFSVDALEQDEVVAALKEAMESPLPRGRGHVVRVVRRMGEDVQREFVPVMLEHLDWQPRRDTMFGAGGQQDAVEMLTQLKVVELVPRLPGLMSKSMRGPGLFDPCIQSIRSFGKDAKPLVPLLKDMVAEGEADPKEAGVWAARDPEKRIAILKETIAHLETL